MVISSGVKFLKLYFPFEFNKGFIVSDALKLIVPVSLLDSIPLNCPKNISEFSINERKSPDSIVGKLAMLGS